MALRWPGPDSVGHRYVARVSALEEVEISTLHLERFRNALGPRFEEVRTGIEGAPKLFEGRVVWHISSTSRGGGVAELLQSLLAYVRGTGVDARWRVITGEPEFFTITKRIHNRLHGAGGDDGPLEEEEREIYERTLEPAARELCALVGERDVVFLHDPQTAGLLAPLRETGAQLVWRCHVGVDSPNDTVRSAWEFLRPYVAGADALVFSRKEFVWDGLDRDRTWIVPPSIDVFSPKNQELDETTVRLMLERIGLTAESTSERGWYARLDGSPGSVDRRGTIHQEAPIPEDATLITQVSRWDRLKDPVGVMHGFAGQLDGSGAHLLLAGPASASVADDPEESGVLADVLDARDSLEAGARARSHIVCLPMDDVQENAAMVNAIQRRSDMIVQKSLAEGFGLTVAEAMWKSRPVVASARGGIRDQMIDGETGILLQDPADLGAFGAALRRLIDDEELRKTMGGNARRRVEEQFLGTRHLLQYLGLLEDLLARRT
jgi:trehalose synthase